MPVPFAFSRRPRRGLRPPPHPNQAQDIVEVVPEPVLEAAPIAEPVEAPAPAPVAEAPAPAPVVEAPAPAPVAEAPAPAPVVEAPAPAPVVEPEPVVEAPAAVKPEWSATMRKAELLAVAQGLGLALTEDNTKAEIVAALEAATA